MRGLIRNIWVIKPDLNGYYTIVALIDFGWRCKGIANLIRSFDGQGIFKYSTGFFAQASQQYIQTLITIDDA